MKYLFFLINVFIISCSTNNNVVEVSNKSNIIHKKQGEIEIIKVYPGDSLSQIALKYRVPLELLAEINNIPHPYQYIGMRSIMIPKGKFYQTKSGDSFYSIAKKYSVDVNEMIEINKMNGVNEKQQLKPGIFLKVPEVQINTRHEYEQVEITEVQPEKYEEIIVQDIPQEDMNLEQANKDINDDREIIVHEAKSSEYFKYSTPLNLSQFIWPLQGQVTKSYDSNKNIEGIIIKGELDAAVKAAASGKILYADNNPIYGNLVIIKHPGGYLTAYGYNNRILVHKDDEVHKGQIIAKVGKSGNATSLGLYFSIRLNKKIIDPETDFNK